MAVQISTRMTIGTLTAMMSQVGYHLGSDFGQHMYDMLASEDCLPDSKATMILFTLDYTGWYCGAHVSDE